MFVRCVFVRLGVCVFVRLYFCAPVSSVFLCPAFVLVILRACTCTFCLCLLFFVLVMRWRTVGTWSVCSRCWGGGENKTYVRDVFVRCVFVRCVFVRCVFVRAYVFVRLYFCAVVRACCVLYVLGVLMLCTFACTVPVLSKILFDNQRLGT